MRKKKCKKCGGRIFPDGCRLCPLFAQGQSAGFANGSGWPMVSEALAVHPKQVGDANARAKRHGINVTYDGKGFCHIPDRNERRKLLRLEALHDNNSFVGY